MLTNPSVTETAATHTPGPWDYTSTAMGYAVTAELMDRVGTPTIVLAEVRDDIDVSDTKANARLIAAAPELLDVLKRIVNAESLLTAWALARGAIAKAETPSSSRS